LAEDGEDDVRTWFCVKSHFDLRRECRAKHCRC